MPPPGPLLSHLPVTADAASLLDAFLAYVDSVGIELYAAQEEAILALFEGDNVIVNTPTGSGKSLIALAQHFRALARHERSWYTAPVKALVSEKFFDLCRTLGSDTVGMLTGDAAINADAPVICCTTEIVANLALRHGAAADVDHVCFDEFHFYSDPDRGWAWQVPLLSLPETTFLLMSATLGDVAFFEEELSRRTERRTTVVRSGERPVPLDFEYRETPVHETIEDLLESGRAPVYIVHFTQAAAADQAQALTSAALVDADRKAALASALRGFRFDTQFGADLKRYLSHGIGVHHAGMLPKYRLLVERLAQDGLLAVVCGTDTLGVGVNVPIRTVLFTQLCKFDGSTTRILSVREFQQIAGRAGRKGFDDEGSVWVLAPSHVIENKRALEKAGADKKKQRKLVRKRAPERGFVPWNADTLARLSRGRPETLESSFHVTHAMLLDMLDRPGDGCAAIKQLLLDNHEPRARQRRHIRRAIQIYRSLLAADVIERLAEPDPEGRYVRVHLDLQADFALNQPLSPFLLDALAELDPASPSWPLDVLSAVEAVQENPRAVLFAQLDRAKTIELARLKAEGVAYEERMEALEAVEWPKPLGEFLYESFDAFRVTHPWAGSDNVRPKSVAREMYERGLGFTGYVKDYGLKRHEGTLLRYLTDVYKGLVQNVPEDVKTDDLYDLTEWLGAVVRQVDSSLLDEWERLRDAAEPGHALAPAPEAGPEGDLPFDVTRNVRAFHTMVRNELFRWVQALARRDYSTFAEVRGETGPCEPDDIAAAMAPYWEEYAEIRTDADARASAWLEIDASGPVWRATQILLDPDGDAEWRVMASVDLARSREEGRAVVGLDEILRL
ncbi:MAG: DUF3516 domain-containing protein [Acidimicrobiia bacterium]|nr:DUF3516 domain-containing protein [Acidimicrobiia bacterium]